jgi:glycosyltransferase involved in cell wall biosynthesis
VYNGAEFIKAALDSLFAQATPQLEVIVVDDGSKDETVACIHKHFSEQIAANNLRVFSQTNQGVSAARNLGIAHASGDYIGFMDSDDLALPNYIPTLLTAVTHDTDIVEFGFKTFIHTIEETQKNPAEYSNPKFGVQPVLQVIDKVYGISRWYPWTRIYKKTLWRHVCFPVGVRFCEDMMTIPTLYEEAKTICVLPEAIYAYRMNPTGATQKVGQDYVEKLVLFYHAIPSLGLMRHDFLRVGLAFTIISCHIKTSGDWVLPKLIQEDMYKFRKNLAFYWTMRPRVIAMLFYPDIFKFFRKFLA